MNDGAVPTKVENPALPDVAAAWPRYYPTELICGNGASGVAVCTLWSRKERIAEVIGTQYFSVCGNLYSLWGINFIVRNLFLRPSIRYLVLCGADTSGSGEALVSLFRGGVDDGHQVIGARGRIDPDIPRDAIDLLRSSVEILDLRNLKKAARIRQVVRDLACRPIVPFCEPRSFDEAEAKGVRFPSGATGHVVERPTVARAWLELLKLVSMFGETKPSEYGLRQKELLNITTVVTHEDPDDDYLPEWLPTTRDQLDRYLPRVLSPERRGNNLQLPLLGAEEIPAKPGEIQGVSYTYGGRLRDYRGVGHDQVNVMIERLRERSFTRRAMAVTWDPFVDGASEHPPCLVQLLSHVRDGRVYVTANFRSHDIYGAWPENTFALRKLQKEIAERVGLDLGPLTVISHSAHIYDDNWNAATEILDRCYPSRSEWRDDPRGNFLISLDEDGILVEHATTEEGKTGVKFKGRTARDLYLQITASGLVSYPEHAAYLGMELGKAELALQLGVEYRQDRLLKVDHQASPISQPHSLDRAEPPKSRA